MGRPKGSLNKAKDESSISVIGPSDTTEDSASFIVVSPGILDRLGSIRESIISKIERDIKDSRLVAAMNGVDKAIFWMKQVEGKNE